MLAFLSVCLQWRVVARAEGGMKVIGLDYAAVKAGLDLAGIDVSPDLWHDIRMIEAGAQREMNGGRS